MNAALKTILRDVVKPVQQELGLFEDQLKQWIQKDPFMTRLFGKRNHRMLEGKRLRPIFLMLCTGVTGGNPKEGIPLAMILEVLHLASLVHDDVVDGSDIRRGSPSLNAQWDNQVAVLMGDYLMAQILALTDQASVSTPGLHALVSETALAMTRGELEQALEKRNPNPSIDRYLQITRSKTAALFSTAGRMGALAAHASPKVIGEMARLGDQFGMAFQIRDDILDYCGDGRAMGKRSGRDYSEGLVTLPALLALERSPSPKRKRMLALLRKHRPEDWNEVREWVCTRESVESARSLASGFASEAREILASFPDSPYRDTLMSLFDFDAVRTG